MAPHALEMLNSLNPGTLLLKTRWFHPRQMSVSSLTFHLGALRRKRCSLCEGYVPKDGMQMGGLEVQLWISASSLASWVTLGELFTISRFSFVNG